MNQTYRPPPPHHLYYITQVYSALCTVLYEPDPWEKKPVFRVDRVQLYITMGDTWSGWQDNGNIMDPGQNIHHIAASEVTDRQTDRPPEDEIPISWTTYMRVLNCVLLCCPYYSYGWMIVLLSVREIQCAPVLNWLFLGFPSVSWGFPQV